MQSTEVVEVVVPAPPMGCSLALSAQGALCTVEKVEPASRAAGAGVREGDVLLTVNGQAPPIEAESERALVDFFRQLRYPLRLAFAQHKGRLVTTLGTLVVYAVAAATLLPDPHHVLWLAMRTLLVAFFVLLDAHMVWMKLRKTPEKFAQTYGTADGGHGWFSWFAVFSLVFFPGCLYSETTSFL